MSERCACVFEQKRRKIGWSAECFIIWLTDYLINERKMIYERIEIYILCRINKSVHYVYDICVIVEFTAV